MLQYLEDFAAQLGQAMLVRWEGGALKLVEEQEARGRILACREVASLGLQPIRDFYGVAAPAERKP